MKLASESFYIIYLKGHLAGSPRLISITILIPNLDDSSLISEIPVSVFSEQVLQFFQLILLY
jgi:hypothetical protein